MRSLLVSIVAIPLVALTPSARAQPIAEGAETPQAVAKRIVAAARAKDGSAYAASVAPADRPMLAFAMTMGVAFTINPSAPNGKAREEEFRALLEKHGLDKTLGPTSPAVAMKDGHPDFDVLMKGVDTVSLLGELVTFAGGAAEPPDFTWIEDPLFDVSIQGSSARARGMKDFYDFVKQDGRWYLKLKAPQTP